MRWRIFPRNAWCSSSAADTARPIGCPTSRGTCSAIRPPARSASRRSATTSITTSPSATRMPARRKTAWEAFNERTGVCRDFAHLAIAFCRCMNIPARYCTGYLGDIGIPPPYGPMDFAAWFEAYIGGQLAHVRSAEQHAAHRPRADRARTRCDRRGHQQHVRSQHAGRFQGVDGRDRRGSSGSSLRPRRRRGDSEPAALRGRLLTVRHRHHLSLFGAGRAGRAPHDVPPARESRSPARQHQAGILPRPSDLRWLHDVFDNSVAIATFHRHDARASFRQHHHAGAHRSGRCPTTCSRSARRAIRFSTRTTRRPDLAAALTPLYPDDELGRGRRASCRRPARPTP